MNALSSYIENLHLYRKSDEEYAKKLEQFTPHERELAEKIGKMIQTSGLSTNMEEVGYLTLEVFELFRNKDFIQVANIKVDEDNQAVLDVARTVKSVLDLKALRNIGLAGVLYTFYPEEPCGDESQKFYTL